LNLIGAGSCAKKTKKEVEEIIPLVPIEEISKIEEGSSDYGTAKGLQSVHFCLNSARSDEIAENKSILRENAKILKENPKMCVQIEGHCDETGMSAIEYNRALSFRRSQQVYEELISLGVPAKQMSTTGCSFEHPLIKNAGKCEKNRRANFVIVTSLPL